ncbi:MAG: hypothetical protein PHH26_03420 [Candidatus Thermoplasmatota archaeon]|nr:hypothetical protein [Candidatus Thermoplasmatota archaeon]
MKMNNVFAAFCLIAVCGFLVSAGAIAQSGGNASFTGNFSSSGTEKITIGAEVNVTSPGEYAINCSFGGVTAASANLGNLSAGIALAHVEVAADNAGKSATLELYKIESGNWTLCDSGVYNIPAPTSGLDMLQIYLIAGAGIVLVAAVALMLVMKSRRSKAVKEIVETSFRLRCPACKQEFIVNDTGIRPLVGKCPHCGKSGTVKK